MDRYLISWTKDAFSMNYSLFVEGKQVGEIKDNSLSRSVKAQFMDQKYVFETENTLKPHINIISLSNKEQLGEITFKTFRPRAQFSLNGHSYFWQFKGMMNSKWELNDELERVVLSGDKRKEGQCSVLSEEYPLLMVCCLVIRNYYMKQGY